MKNTIRLFTLSAVLIFFAGTAGAAYETAQQVTIEILRKDTRNLVIEWDGAKKLLHYAGNCDEMVEGKPVTLVVQGDLNGNGDYIKINSYRTCKIDQVEEITGKLAVDYVYNGDTYALVTDEKGNQFEVQFDERCYSIPRSFKDYVYVRQYGSLLQKSDELVLSRAEGKCPLLYVTKKKVSTPSNQPAKGDIIPPGMANDVKAIPKNGAAYVYWKAASDNIKIDYYWVSYSPDHIDPKDYKAAEMPNLTKSTGTNITISGLRNEKTYYFYVLAVDTSGNMSPGWSAEAKAMPRSSISPTPVAAPIEKLYLHMVQESDASFLFKWNTIEGILRTNVLLEVNGKREFVLYDYLKNMILIAKKIDYSGKSMKLIVRFYDIHGQMKEESVNFQFQK